VSDVPEAELAIAWDALLRRRTVLSPLRYPGGKRRLVPFVAAALQINQLKTDLFVEPFAGGASVALELAHTEAVNRIGLADSDPWVASFWQTVFWDCDWLVEQVNMATVTLEAWQALKDDPPVGRREQAWACLFLNRTSYNGALHHRAGPIGGKAGTSEYSLDCRFPRQRLVTRLRACEQLAIDDRVAFVEQAPALEVVQRARSLAGGNGDALFFYLDPPFWAKSQWLYRHSFAESDHKHLADQLRLMSEPWLLSYDPAPEIETLYTSHGARIATIELLYTASQRAAGKELVISTLERLPSDTRLWRTSPEWQELRLATAGS
jgi:DNA adenine methylase